MKHFTGYRGRKPVAPVLRAFKQGPFTRKTLFWVHGSVLTFYTFYLSGPANRQQIRLEPPKDTCRLRFFRWSRTGRDAFMGALAFQQMDRIILLPAQRMARPRYNRGARQASACPAYYREVRLDAYRETDGHGQGSGLSGKAESQFAGLRFARLAASQ